jgi:hypothetical protein
MKNVSIVVLLATIAFFVVTASSADIGTDFLFRQDTYGFPNKFLTITYEKAEITNLDINTENMLFNFGFCLAIVACVRLLFLFMKVKRTPLETLNAKSKSLVKSQGSLAHQSR